MANNYVETSFLIPLTKEQQEYAEMVYDLDCKDAGFCLKRESDGVWLYAEEYADIDTLTIFTHHLVRKFQLKPIGFTWSETCSKPRLDEFAGGAAVISQKGVQIWSAWTEMQKMLRDESGD